MTTDPLQSLTGDVAGALVLRRSLTAMVEQVGPGTLADRIRAVLAGRTDVRELADDPQFAAFTRAGMESFDQTWGAMSPAERDSALQAGTAYLDDLEEATELRRR